MIRSNTRNLFLHSANIILCFTYALWIHYSIVFGVVEAPEDVFLKQDFGAGALTWEFFNFLEKMVIREISQQLGRGRGNFSLQLGVGTGDSVEYKKPLYALWVHYSFLFDFGAVDSLKGVFLKQDFGIRQISYQIGGGSGSFISN